MAIKNITDRISDFEFHLITARLDKKSSKQEKIGNIFVFRVGGPFSFFWFFLPKIFLSLAVFSKARSLLKENDYKLVHAFQASGAAGAGWLLKFSYPRLPFMITMQEGKNLERQCFLINFFRRLIIKKADRATAISRYLSDYILKVRKDLSVEIIPNGVDLENFSRQFSYGELIGLENKLGIKPDEKVIVSVSRLVRKNGLDLLLRALAILKNSDPDRRSKLLLIGQGREERNLRRLAGGLDVREGIIFGGEIGNENLPRYFGMSDVFVRPSRSEGLGTAFLEAMAAGVPVIGTQVGGVPDFLEDRKTGLFCTDSPEDIASKINLILEDETLRREIIKNARLLVEEKYDWNKIAEKYKQIYRRVMLIQSSE